MADVDDYSRRPMAYFSHDSNAASDIKCKRLIRACGMAGYGRWWRLCEMMAAADDHVLFTDGDQGDILADDLMFDSRDELMGYLSTLERFGLVESMPATESHDAYISSDRMQRNAAYFGRKRSAGAKGGKHAHRA